MKTYYSSSTAEGFFALPLTSLDSQDALLLQLLSVTLTPAQQQQGEGAHALTHGLSAAIFLPLFPVFSISAQAEAGREEFPQRASSPGMRHHGAET